MNKVVLHPNDTVALVAPSGFIPDESPIKVAVQWLERMGLRAWVGKNVLQRSGVFAGTDAQRLTDFQEAIDNPEIKAIWALRGGYGAMRIVNSLDYTALKQHPKLLIGFSDITVFHNQWQLLDLPGIHGIMPIQMAKNPYETKLALASLQKALFGNTIEYTFNTSNYSKFGKTNGVLTGGNLTLLQNLIGTPYQVNTKGKILFIEDVSEYMYRIDRLLYSLKLAGIFKHLKGLIVGGFNEINEGEVSFGKSIEEMILEVTHQTDYPIVFDFPAGHFPDNRALILGSNVQIKVNNFESKIIFIQ